MSPLLTPPRCSLQVFLPSSPKLLLFRINGVELEKHLWLFFFFLALHISFRGQVRSKPLVSRSLMHNMVLM